MTKRAKYPASKELRQEMDRKMWATGGYVVLHPESYVGEELHPEAGRIGKIVSCRGQDIVVEMASGEVQGRFLVGIPKQHYAPMPAFMVEEYLDNGMTRYRLTEDGYRIATNMGWLVNARTRGLA